MSSNENPTIKEEPSSSSQRIPGEDKDMDNIIGNTTTGNRSGHRYNTIDNSNISPRTLRNINTDTDSPPVANTNSGKRVVKSADVMQRQHRERRQQLLNLSVGDTQTGGDMLRAGSRRGSQTSLVSGNSRIQGARVRGSNRESYNQGMGSRRGSLRSLGQQSCSRPVVIPLAKTTSKKEELNQLASQTDDTYHKEEGFSFMLSKSLNTFKKFNDERISSLRNRMGNKASTSYGRIFAVVNRLSGRGLGDQVYRELERILVGSSENTNMVENHDTNLRKTEEELHEEKGLQKELQDVTTEDLSYKLVPKDTTTSLGAVYDLSEGDVEGFLIGNKVCNEDYLLVCGGDGTQSWLMNVLDELKVVSVTSPVNTPSIVPGIPIFVPIPLGSGNDLARACGWPPFLKSLKSLGMIVEVIISEMEKRGGLKEGTKERVKDNLKVNEDNYPSPVKIGVVPASPRDNHKEVDDNVVKEELKDFVDKEGYHYADKLSSHTPSSIASRTGSTRYEGHFEEINVAEPKKQDQNLFSNSIRPIDIWRFTIAIKRSDAVKYAPELLEYEREEMEEIELGSGRESVNQNLLNVVKEEEAEEREVGEKEVKKEDGLGIRTGGNLIDPVLGKTIM